MCHSYIEKCRGNDGKKISKYLKNVLFQHDTDDDDDGNGDVNPAHFQIRYEGKL